jgi:coenzyme F420-reducing hydrogenase delta subunit
MLHGMGRVLFVWMSKKLWAEFCAKAFEEGADVALLGSAKTLRRSLVAFGVAFKKNTLSD